MSLRILYHGLQLTVLKFKTENDNRLRKKFDMHHQAVDNKISKDQSLMKTDHTANTEGFIHPLHTHHELV